MVAQFALTYIRTCQPSAMGHKPSVSAGYIDTPSAVGHCSRLWWAGNGMSDRCNIRAFGPECIHSAYIRTATLDVARRIHTAYIRRM